MNTYILHILFLSVLFGSAFCNPTAADSAEIDAEIAKFPGNITRLSTLPLDTVYTIDQQFLNTTSGRMEIVSLHTTVRELLGATPINPSGDIHKRDDPFGIICETTSGSPNAVHIYKALAAIAFSEREFCCQFQPFRSKCHEMQRYDTGAVGMCGPFMRCVPCDQYIELMLIFVDRCKHRFMDGMTLVGGKFNLGNLGESGPFGGICWPIRPSAGVVVVGLGALYFRN